MIRFKTQDTENEFRFIDQRLRRIIHVMDSLAWAMWREDLWVTCILRKRELSHKDTHYKQRKPYRFVDMGLMQWGDNDVMRDVINRMQRLRKKVSWFFFFFFFFLDF